MNSYYYNLSGQNIFILYSNYAIVRGPCANIENTYVRGGRRGTELL